jgi:hypothetical protein
MLNSRQTTHRRVSEDTPLESRQYFTTVLDVPDVGPESATTSVQTTVPQVRQHVIKYLSAYLYS